MEINGLKVPEEACEIVASILEGDVLDEFNRKKPNIGIGYHQLKALIEALTHWGIHMGYDLAHKDNTRDGV